MDSNGRLMQVYVGGLNKDTDERRLGAAFRERGLRVTDVRVSYGARAGRVMRGRARGEKGPRRSIPGTGARAADVVVPAR